MLIVEFAFVRMFPKTLNFENCVFHNLEKIFNFFNPPSKEKMSTENMIWANREEPNLQDLTAYQDKYSSAMNSMKYLNPIGVSPDDIHLPKTSIKSSKVMDFAGIGAVVDSASQIGGMMLQNKYQKEAEKRSNEEWQRRFDVENAYNAPSAQAERLRDAGINPLAQMSGTAPTPSASGSTNNPQSPSQQIDTDFAGVALSMQELRLREKELQIMEKKTDADIRNLDADTAGKQGTEFRASDLHERHKKLMDLDIESSTIENYVRAATADTEIAMSKQQLSNLYNEGMKLISEIVNTDMDTDKKFAEIQDIYSEIAYREIQSELAKANISLTYAEVEQVFKSMEVMDSDILLKEANANLAEGQLAFTLEDINRLKSITEGQNIKNSLDKKYGGAQRIVGMVTDSLNSVSGVINSVKPWGNLVRVAKSATQRADNAEKQVEQSYEQGYRDGHSSRTSSYPQYRTYKK